MPESRMMLYEPLAGVGQMKFPAIRLSPHTSGLLGRRDRKRDLEYAILDFMLKGDEC